MGTNVFYNMVKEYAESLIKQRPESVAGDNAICAIFTSKHDIFTGVTGISQPVSAEHLAINAMCKAEQSKARQMITISLADFSVLSPNPEGVSELIKINPENDKCEVFISTNESVKACELDLNNKQFFDGFDTQDSRTETAGKNTFEKMGIVSESQPEQSSADTPKEELGSPADFSSGFDIDITNPFYEAPAEDKEVKTISHTSAEKPMNTVNSNAGNSTASPAMSKDELLKQAKKRKKIAKNIFSAKRK